MEPHQIQPPVIEGFRLSHDCGNGCFTYFAEELIVEPTEIRVSMTGEESTQSDISVEVSIRLYGGEAMSDAILISPGQMGDPTALGELIRKHAGQMTRLLYGLLT